MNAGTSLLGGLHLYITEEDGGAPPRHWYQYNMKKKTTMKKKIQRDFNFIAFAASARNPSRASPIINIAVPGKYLTLCNQD